MPYTIQDIIDGAYEKEPSRVQAAFDELIGSRIMDALEVRKKEIATNLFKGASEEETDDTNTDAEAEDAESQDA